ncbi:hypothetical protein BYT27DRAFT_7209905 [Phlegmacium glaucopus]|nr:hypothetical protein BYT27DRAFT_7209905 [Phlegmacium glaucopus]
MIDGMLMPPVSKVLAATIGVTFVGPKNLPEKTMPKFFRVRRKWVRNALEWLKANNPLYNNIIISNSRLATLPEDGVPYELMATAKHSTDVDMLYTEQDGYVPVEDIEEVDDTQDIDKVSEGEHGDLELPTEAGVLPLAHLGVVNVDGVEVTDSELLAHALANCCEGRQEEDYMIRRGSAFVNEYARIDPITGQRNDGGPSDANHLLGSFPTLSPFGQGGFEIEHGVNVPYETHVRWALRLWCLPKVTECSIIYKRRGSDEGKQRRNMSTVKTKVQGSDESRKSIRGKIWGMNLLHNPPSLWVTINPSDNQDPIAQVFAGADIDLDRFCETAGPDCIERAINIASDPYASAKYFHFIITTILEVLIGVTKHHNGMITRKEGIFGVVKSYIGTVEAQGRGSLHLHLLLWLDGAPTARELKTALKNGGFRDKMKRFVGGTIQADIDGKSFAEVVGMTKVESVSYSRPLDPRKPADVKSMMATEFQLARMTQLHQCSVTNCLKVIKGRMTCKRRAPFPLAGDNWVDSSGGWGPKRLCGFLNNWNPPLLMSIRANHDVKLFMNGSDMSVLTWYITNYASKKQQRSSNVSALLAKRVAFHKVEEKGRVDVANVSKRLIQRCVNTLTREREFSGPEVISYLMGWGDRYESHHHVSIYTDALISAVKKKFPGLGDKRDIYCAIMLVLLKPWNDLADLKIGGKSFEESFQLLVNGATKKTLDIIENIQYYYECYDGAKKREQETCVDGPDRTVDFEQEASTEDLTTDCFGYTSEAIETTEEDIEFAYELRGTMREKLYAQVLMDTAMGCGIFLDIQPQTVYLPNVVVADSKDLVIFRHWEEQLKKATKKEAEGGGPVLFAGYEFIPQVEPMIEPRVDAFQADENGIPMECDPPGRDANVLANLKDDVTKILKRRVELAVGMKAMVVLNIATDVELANGTRGTIEGIVLDSRERNVGPDEDGNIQLMFPPSVIFFKPETQLKIMFDGLEEGIIPISPSLLKFSVKVNGERLKLERRQIAIVPGYAFTDYKAQGQTLECIIIDIAKPPSGTLSPFNVYVALSRSRGRKTIRILRDFDPELFMHHPLEDLRRDMTRLEELDSKTKVEHERQQR